MLRTHTSLDRTALQSSGTFSNFVEKYLVRGDNANGDYVIQDGDYMILRGQRTTTGVLGDEILTGWSLYEPAYVDPNTGGLTFSSVLHSNQAARFRFRRIDTNVPGGAARHPHGLYQISHVTQEVVPDDDDDDDDNTEEEGAVRLEETEHFCARSSDGYVRCTFSAADMRARGFGDGTVAGEEYAGFHVQQYGGFVGGDPATILFRWAESATTSTASDWKYGEFRDSSVGNVDWLFSNAQSPVTNRTDTSSYGIYLVRFPEQLYADELDARIAELETLGRSVASEALDALGALVAASAELAEDATNKSQTQRLMTFVDMEARAEQSMARMAESIEAMRALVVRLEGVLAQDASRSTLDVLASRKDGAPMQTIQPSQMVLLARGALAHARAELTEVETSLATREREFEAQQQQQYGDEDASSLSSDEEEEELQGLGGSDDDDGDGNVARPTAIISTSGGGDDQTTTTAEEEEKKKEIWEEWWFWVLVGLVVLLLVLLLVYIAFRRR